MGRATLLGLLPLVVMGLSMVLPSGTAAQRRAQTPPDPGVAVSVAPDSARAESPYAYLFELRGTTPGSSEVVADRRLLTFVVHVEGRRRPLTCRHPDAPRTASPGRVRTLGGGESPVWRETIDLRMYCWGRALEALSAGARVEVRYGFGRRARRDKWVARQIRRGEGTTGAMFTVASLEGPEFTFSPIADIPESGGPSSDESSESGDETPPRVAISMANIDVSRGASVTFRPRLRATGDAVRVYLRDDLFRFDIRGPLGEHSCALDRTPIAPIIDFYTRLRGSRRAGGTVSVQLACGDAFMLPGIYEVTPSVDLVYDAGQYDVDDVVTGTVTGAPALVRVRRGDRGYLEQVPEAEPAER